MQPFFARHNEEEKELVHFWGLGDLHFQATEPWQTLHTQRLTPLYTDLKHLWQTEGLPEFYVSPGDIVETCALKNYQLAKQQLQEHLGSVPFYPGVGNHEFTNAAGEDPATLAPTFTQFWNKPLHYTWEAGEHIFIMLDYPNPYTLANQVYVFISQQTLAFLEDTLTRYQSRPAVIFLHCPLSNTVGDRDPKIRRDYNSHQHFFAPENSQEVRAILARHKNACLFISGHTHSGWEAPNLVLTEELGNHPVTFVNLMSPWYTGSTKTGPRPTADGKSWQYVPDEPNVVTSFSFRIYRDHINIRVREHLSQSWLKTWNVPI